MGTPLGPKYVPYTYMDPLGRSFEDFGILEAYKDRHWEIHFLASRSLGILVNYHLGAGGG